MKFTFKNTEDYKTQRTALENKIQELIDGGKIDDANAQMTDLTDMDKAYEDYAKAQANLNANKGVQSKTLNDILKGGVKMENNTGATYASKADMLNSVEYRTAFMNNVISGQAMPKEFLNTAAQTTTSDVSSIIPTVLVQKIYSKLENYGKFFAMATKTNFKGGVTVPTSAIELSASWVAERGTSETQKYTTGSVVFAYHKLICKVALSFEADVVTLDIFEADLVEKVSKAMMKAVEQAMFTGTGSTGNQLTGFLTETVATGQNIDITEGNHITYADLVNAEAALPEEYETNAVWVMPKKTYYREIVGMVDDNGQPIARTNIGLGGQPEHTILGRRVEFAPYMSAFATSVTADTIVAAIFDFSSYVINTNYTMTIKKYTDENTDDQITKALMLVDGKTIDKNSLVTVTVKNS